MGLFADPDENCPAAPPLSARPSKMRRRAPRPGPPVCLRERGEDEVRADHGDEDGGGRRGRQIKISRDCGWRLGWARQRRANSVIVSGEVLGDCSGGARRHPVHRRLTGNIRAPKIVIAEGAVFRGNSDMSPRQGETRPGIMTGPGDKDRKVALS